MRHSSRWMRTYPRPTWSTLDPDCCLSQLVDNPPAGISVPWNNGRWGLQFKSWTTCYVIKQKIKCNWKWSMILQSTYNKRGLGEEKGQLILNYEKDIGVGFEVPAVKEICSFIQDLLNLTLEYSLHSSMNEVEKPTSIESNYILSNWFPWRTSLCKPNTEKSYKNITILANALAKFSIIKTMAGCLRCIVQRTNAIIIKTMHKLYYYSAIRKVLNQVVKFP